MGWVERKEEVRLTWFATCVTRQMGVRLPLMANTERNHSGTTVASSM